ncbi:phosphate acetyltransferase [Rarobacter faecitabidus]|uniref:Phosphate acetyltransferase n=1 Tax=Rarobacter faecitabidus TaxID=13243 RepID=A0A542ZXD9_RARFA|nr:phosphate acetyltransferase [Rarobacter faecitabidus]TQL65022.1 phosphate acetyltransferase [Rarobacter faecitabidus]
MTTARSIYITSPEGETGKGAIALGVVDLLAREVKRVGVFRPIARTKHATPGATQDRDYVLDLLLAHDGVNLTTEQATGVHYEDLHSDPEAAMSRIVTKYHEIERECDVVVIVGSDYTDVAGPTELSFNAQIATNLGAPVLLVVSGAHRSHDDIQQLIDVAAGVLHVNHASLIGAIVNKAIPEDADELRRVLTAAQAPVWVLPDSSLLAAPTVRQLVGAVDGEVVSGDAELLDREALDVIIGAMNIDHLIDRLTDGGVVITPGDRSDILLGLLMAHSATNFPSLAGIILNGGFEPAPQVSRLVADLGLSLPIIKTNYGTFKSANLTAAVRGRVSNASQRKKDLALTLFEQNVDGAALLDALAVERPQVITPLMFEYDLLTRARAERKRIVLPEGDDDRILRAASTLLQRQVADLTILGNEAQIRTRAAALGLDLSDATFIDPTSSPLIEEFAQVYSDLRKHKGMTVDRAREIVPDVSYFGTLMVHLGYADGMVSGAAHTTAHTIKPSFEIIKTIPGTSVVSSVFLMCLADRVLAYGDCAVNPDPTAEQLADIAISSAQTAAQFGVEPRIAMLSYSTGASGSGVDVDKVREATRLVKERRPDLSVEGPIQYDAAVDASVAASKMPGSDVAGRATVFIFPDLNTGNNTYKAVQRSSGAVAIGPVLQGLRKPVNDLSRGALVQDIVNTVAITAIQAQSTRSIES